MTGDQHLSRQMVTTDSHSLSVIVSDAQRYSKTSLVRDSQ